MIIIRVDDLDAPLEARTLSSDLAALGAEFEIQITLRESAWIHPAIEHIKIFIQTPLGIAVTAGLTNQIIRFSLHGRRSSA